MSETGKIFSGRRVTLTPEQMRQENNTCLLALDILKTPLASEDVLPDDLYIPPATEDPLVTQIAEPGGLHACDMTATTNAYIWQGWLTGKQGEEVHRRFTEYDPDREFAQRTIGGKTVLITSRDEHVIGGITKEKLFSASIMQKELDKAEVIQLVLSALVKGLVLNIGDGGHARLAVGYKQKNKKTELWTSNPYRPNKIDLRPIEEVLQFHNSNAIFGVARKAASLKYRPDIAFTE